MSKPGAAPRKSRFPASLTSASAPPASPRAGPSGREPLRPQQPVEQAVRDAARVQPPSGLGLDSLAVRRRMVERLAAQGHRHPAVLDALLAVPRHAFVDTALIAQAYEDTSLPIGWGQTISKPSVVARMIALLHEGARARQLGHLGRVLEIGTGCGYQAALLSRLGRQVISIERLEPLHQLARQRLAGLRDHRLMLIWGDGRLGHAPRAPYDSLIAAAGGDDVPADWLDQVAVGGRIVAPVHAPHSGGHVITVLDRTEEGWVRTVHDPVHFVPLKSGAE